MPAYVIPVDAGMRLSVVADVRAASGRGSIAVRWYLPGTTEPDTVELPIPPRPTSSDDCEQVRLDVTVPEGVVGALPVVSLTPPGGPEPTDLRVDDVRLVRWGVADAPADVVNVVSGRTLTVVAPMPGVR
jgi:hypothetical protein